MITFRACHHQNFDCPVEICVTACNNFKRYCTLPYCVTGVLHKGCHHFCFKIVCIYPNCVWIKKTHNIRSHTVKFRCHKVPAGPWRITAFVNFSNNIYKPNYNGDVPIYSFLYSMRFYSKYSKCNRLWYIKLLVVETETIARITYNVIRY